MRHKEEYPSYFDCDPGTPIITTNSGLVGLQPNKTQRHATYFRVQTKNDSIDKWFMPAPRSRCACWLAGLLSAPHNTKAIDCDLRVPTFRDSCKLVCRSIGNTPLNIYLNTGGWYSSSVHPLNNTVHTPARRPALRDRAPFTTSSLSPHSLMDTWGGHFSEISWIVSV